MLTFQLKNLLNRQNNLNTKIKVGFDLCGTLGDIDKQVDRYTKLHEGVQYLPGVEGFYYTMPAIEQAVECFKRLQKLDNVELYIIAEGGVRSPSAYTEVRLWAEQWVGLESVKNLIIAEDKSMILLDVLIDDRLSGNGIEDFLGVVFQVERFVTDWDELYNTVEIMADEYIDDMAIEGTDLVH